MSIKVVSEIQNVWLSCSGFLPGRLVWLFPIFKPEINRTQGWLNYKKYYKRLHITFTLPYSGAQRSCLHSISRHQDLLEQELPSMALIEGRVKQPSSLALPVGAQSSILQTSCLEFGFEKIFQSLRLSRHDLEIAM